VIASQSIRELHALKSSLVTKSVRDEMQEMEDENRKWIEREKEEGGGGGATNDRDDRVSPRITREINEALGPSTCPPPPSRRRRSSRRASPVR